jgi:hypothetical protein
MRRGQGTEAARKADGEPTRSGRGKPGKRRETTPGAHRSRWIGGHAAGVSRDTERKKLWHISKTDESMKKIFGKMLQKDSLFEKNCQK